MTPPGKPSRRFTKRVLIVNMVLVWALMFLSVVYQEAQHVVPAAFALIGVLFGTYTGVGHMDLRSATRLALEEYLVRHADESIDTKSEVTGEEG